MNHRNSPLFTDLTVPATAQVPLSCGRINISGYALNSYQSINPEGYTILCETGKYCDMLHFFPQTNTIVLEGNTQSYLLFKDFPKRFIPDLAKELKVTLQSPFEKSINFFDNKNVVVQPSGFQATIYNLMRYMQNYVPVAYTFEAASVAKTTGLSGLKIIQGAPLTFVGATYLGGIVFSYFGAVAGNNPLGAVLNASSYILTRPMWCVETTLNNLALRPISNVIGLPLVLNGTNELP